MWFFFVFRSVIAPTAEYPDESIALEESSQSIQPIRRRSVKTTIVGNKQLIDAKLETFAESDDFLKLKGTVGYASTNGLLQTILASHHYALSLQSRHKFWVDADAPMNESDDESAIFSAASVDLQLKWVPSSGDVVRPKIIGYEISNVPCERFR